MVAFAIAFQLRKDFQYLTKWAFLLLLLFLKSIVKFTTKLTNTPLWWSCPTPLHQSSKSGRDNSRQLQQGQGHIVAQGGQTLLMFGLPV